GRGTLATWHPGRAGTRGTLATRHPRRAGTRGTLTMRHPRRAGTRGTPATRHPGCEGAWHAAAPEARSKAGLPFAGWPSLRGLAFPSRAGLLADERDR